MAGETLLVIDDSPTILKVLELVLAKAGYRVVTASDGEEGIERALACHPDLILLDFLMPKMNGYQVVRELQDREALADTPVILMSAKGDQVGDRFVKMIGIVDYVTKPFPPEAIIAVVQHTLKKHAERALAAESAAALLPDVSPSEAVDVAHAQMEARRLAMERFRRELIQSASTAVMQVVQGRDSAPNLDAAQVTTWIGSSLTAERIELLLGDLRTAAPELVGAENAVLTGDLRLVPLAEVLLLLQEQHQQGILTVARERAQVDLHFFHGGIDLATAAGVDEEFLLGRFIVKQNLMSREDLDDFLQSRTGSTKLLGYQLVKLGYITPDDLRNAIRQQTCELVYELLRWDFGRFTFRAAAEPLPMAAEAALQLRVDNILMEGVRRVDEWHLIGREIDSFDLVFVRNEDALSRMGRGRLTREELTILELVDGKNTVTDIVRQSRLGSFEVSKMLYRLLAVKLVRKRVRPLAV